MEQVREAGTAEKWNKREAKDRRKGGKRQEVQVKGVSAAIVLRKSLVCRGQ